MRFDHSQHNSSYLRVLKNKDHFFTYLVTMALENSKKQEDQRRKPFKNYGRKPEEKGIPILKFGKANNFYKFRAALCQMKQRRSLEI